MTRVALIHVALKRPSPRVRIPSPTGARAGAHRREVGPPPLPRRGPRGVRRRATTNPREEESSPRFRAADLKVHGVLGEEVLALRRLGNHAKERLQGQTRDREQGGEQDGHREAELALALWS